MGAIYEPRGKAREYSPLALNLYAGCAHGCEYCFAPAATFKKREVFARPRARVGIIKQVQKDAVRLHGDPRQVLLSFTTDPYQPIEAEEGLTRQALKILKENNISATILTKGGLRATKDFDILANMPGSEFAVTLTTDNEEESRRWEPGAALPSERIKSLKLAKGAELRTWISFEPVINPDAVFRMIEQTYTFVDFYKVGKLNYHPFAKEIDWKKFGLSVIQKLKDFECDYLIKKDLMREIKK